MREGRWLNAAAIVTWLICGLTQFVAIAQREFGGWPAAVVAARRTGRLAARAGRAQPDARPLQSASAHRRPDRGCIDGHHAVARYRLGANSTPALLVIIAATFRICRLDRPSARPATQLRLKPRGSGRSSLR
jgi:hypothetical protein